MLVGIGAAYMLVTMGRITFKIAPQSVLLPLAFTAVGMALLYVGSTEPEEWFNFFGQDTSDVAGAEKAAINSDEL